MIGSLTQRPKDHVAQFDGVRALASITIVLFHSFCVATLFFDRAANAAWRVAPFARIYTIGVGALDIFWVVGGYFVTLGAVRAIDDGVPLVTMVVKLAVNRLARFWPLMLALVGYSIVRGEQDHFNVPAYFFFFLDRIIDPPHTNRLSVPYFLVPTWSLSVDFQMQLALPIVLFVAKKLRIISSRLCIVIALLGVAARMAVWSETQNNFMIMASDRLFLPDAVLIQAKSDLLTKLYGYTPHYVLRDYEGANDTGIYQSALYYPTEMRVSPFFLGAALALSIAAYNAASAPRRDVPAKPARSLIAGVFFSLVSHLLLAFAIFALLMPTLAPPPPPVPIATQVIITGIVHFLPALAVFYILYASLVPPSHPLAIGWIRSFLSLRLWYPLSQLSFAVYLVHWRVLLWAYFALINPAPRDITHGNILYAFGVGLLVSYCVAVPLHLFVELPVWNLVRRLTSGRSKAKRN